MLVVSCICKLNYDSDSYNQLCCTKDKAAFPWTIILLYRVHTYHYISVLFFLSLGNETEHITENCVECFKDMLDICKKKCAKFRLDK